MKKKWFFLCLIGCQLAFEALSLINAHLPGRIIDSLIENRMQGMLFYVCALAVGEIGLNTVVAYCTAGKNRWYHLQRNLASGALAGKFGSLRLDAFEKDVAGKRQLLGLFMGRESKKAIIEAVSSGSVKIVASVVLFVIYPFFSFYSICMIIALAVVGAVAEMLYTRYDLELKDSYAETTESMHKALWSMTKSTYAKEIRIFRLEEFLAAKYNDAREKLYNLLRLKNRKGMKIDLLSALSEGIGLFASFGFAVMAVDDDFTVGTFFIAANVTQLVFRNFVSISKSAVAIWRESRYLKEYNDFLTEDDGWQSGAEGSGPEVQEIEFKDVSFAYPGARKQALDGLSFKIQKGEKIALVGENGAGKSTIVRLLSGLYRPDTGKILVNGKNLEETDVAAYHRQFSAVYQDAVLFDYSIGENIVMRETEEYEECDHAGSKLDMITDRAGLIEKIRSLSQRYKTMLSRRFDPDGISLSGGERQKLLLARALYKDSPFLVFDEPTAAMSPAAENDMYETYGKMTGGKTAVYISHRLAGCRMSDRILVIKDGRLAEEGTHEELMKLEDGIYRKMFLLQAKGYEED